MTDWVPIDKDKAHISREKQKARALRKTQWWKNKIAEGLCYYCGRVFKPQELTMDHIVPIARGGKSNRGNIVPCCKDCNNKKKYLTPAEIVLNQLKPQDDE